MAVALMLYSYFVAKKYDFPKSERPTLRETGRSLKAAFFPLMTPVVLLGGIYGGVFTPTEAAAVAALYALIVGLTLERDVKYSKLVSIGIEIVVYTGITMFIVAAATTFSWIIAREQIPQMLTSWVLDAHLSKYGILLILNILFLVLGALFDTNTIMLIFIPMVLPIVKAAGIDLVHFGVVVVLNLMIGLLTPPFGMLLFLISGLTKVPIRPILKKLWPMIIVLITVLFLITYVDGFVLWLPNLVEGVAK